MGFSLKKLARKVIPKPLRRLDTAQALIMTGGASLLLKQKQQRQLGKAALGIGAAIAAYTFIPGVSSMFSSRAPGQTSEQNTTEGPGVSVSDQLRSAPGEEAGTYGSGGGFWSSLFKSRPSASQVGVAAGTGAAATACQALSILLGGG